MKRKQNIKSQRKLVIWTYAMIKMETAAPKSTRGDRPISENRRFLICESYEIIIGFQMNTIRCQCECIYKFSILVYIVPPTNACAVLVRVSHTSMLNHFIFFSHFHRGIIILFSTSIENFATIDAYPYVIQTSTMHIVVPSI